MIALEMRDIAKKYGHLWALNSISLDIEDGEAVAIFGPNGAGKTTLIKVAGTQISPSSGRMRMFGADPHKNGVRIRGQIGLVAHESFLYDELTVEENMRFYARAFSVARDDVEGVIDSLNIRRWYGVRVRKLSHGMRKRADIARALIHDPSLLLVDELFSGLDEESCNLLIDYLRNRKKGAIMISSHSIDWARKLCERGIYLNRGRKVQESRL